MAHLPSLRSIPEKIARPVQTFAHGAGDSIT